MTDYSKLVERLNSADQYDPESVRRMAKEAAAAIVELSQAPASPAEPVAWRYRHWNGMYKRWDDWHYVAHKPQGINDSTFQKEPLYAHPAALSDEHIESIIRAIYSDISDRSGLSNELDQIDDEVKIEMKDAWRKAIREALEAAQSTLRK